MLVLPLMMMMTTGRRTSSRMTTMFRMMTTTRTTTITVVIRVLLIVGGQFQEIELTMFELIRFWYRRDKFAGRFSIALGLDGVAVFPMCYAKNESRKGWQATGCTPYTVQAWPDRTARSDTYFWSLHASVKRRQVPSKGSAAASWGS